MVNKRVEITKETEQYIFNKSFDEDFNVVVTEPVEYSPDGTLKRKVSPLLTTRIDEADSNTIYIGKAKIGALTSDAVWQIKKISTSATITSILWADGNDAFDNVWDNRVSLNYS